MLLQLRRMNAVEDRGIEVYDLNDGGNGLQGSTLVKHKVQTVFMELISDECMAGRQHFGFKISTNAQGDRHLAVMLMNQ